MEQRQVVGMFSRVVGLVLAGMLLSGCPSVYIKTTAGTFTEAGKKATKAIHESTERLDTALDAGRAVAIANDVTCPIEEARLFVRDDDSGLNIFSSAAKRFPGQAGQEDCQVLIRCSQENAGLSGNVSAECKGVCFNAQEGACLSSFELHYANALISADGKPVKPAPDLENEVKNFIAFLRKTEYQRAGSFESQLMNESLISLTQYLDLLGKLTEDRKSEAAEDAKKLSERIGTITANVEKVRKEKLSDEDKKTQAQAQGVITSIGKLADTLTVIAQRADDAKKIEAIVNGNKADINALVEHLRNIAVGNNYAAMIKTDMVAEKIRADLQEQYRKSGSMRERRMLLEERNAIKFSDGAKSINSIDQVFTDLLKAHDALVSLINDPTDEQKRKMAEARFEEFKSIVSDVADVVAAVK
ncbi:TPA: hypothetical protein NIA45_004601 [Pseudomonas aeruginosa]|nr:hypothetical protein [Pseudomonas aeruginosa]